MTIPSERRPGKNLDFGNRTARHYARQASMSLDRDGRMGLNLLYERIKDALPPKIAQIDTLYRRLRSPRG